MRLPDPPVDETEAMRAWVERVVIEPHPTAGTFVIWVAHDESGTYRSPFAWNWKATVCHFYRYAEWTVPPDERPWELTYGHIELQAILGMTRWGVVRSARWNAKIQRVYDLPVFQVPWDAF